MKSRVLLLLFAILLSVSVVSASNSLWSDDSANLYKSKEKAYSVGDIVTVIIEEDTNAVQSANTSTSQGSSVDAGAGFGLFSFLTSFGFNYGDDDDAQGQTQRTGSIEADITATIVDTTDNGNFKIEGTKKIKVNGEEQIIKLLGVIRKEDIDEENNVSSKNLADASIELEGQGVVTEKQRPNIFQRFLNWIF